MLSGSPLRSWAIRDRPPPDAAGRAPARCAGQLADVGRTVTRAARRAASASADARTVSSIRRSAVACSGRGRQREGPCDRKRLARGYVRIDLGILEIGEPHRCRRGLADGVLGHLDRRAPHARLSKCPVWRMPESPADRPSANHPGCRPLQSRSSERRRPCARGGLDGRCPRRIRVAVSLPPSSRPARQQSPRRSSRPPSRPLPFGNASRPRSWAATAGDGTAELALVGGSGVMT
jgi:hypothetical protein